MQARVKSEAGSPRVIRACAGAEFVKEEWRLVPAGREDEARRNPFLEVAEDGAVAVAKAAAEKVEAEGLKMPEPIVEAGEDFSIILAGNVNTVRDMIVTMSDPAALAAMRQAEEDDKGRKGVLEAIDDRLKELG